MTVTKPLIGQVIQSSSTKFLRLRREGQRNTCPHQDRKRNKAYAKILCIFSAAEIPNLQGYRQVTSEVNFAEFLDLM